MARVPSPALTLTIDACPRAAYLDRVAETDDGKGDDLGAGPYRSRAPGPNAADASSTSALDAFVEADQARRRAGADKSAARAKRVLANLALGRVVHADPAVDFRTRDDAARVVAKLMGEPWLAGYRARWNGYGIGAAPDASREIRELWIHGWRQAHAERARAE